MAIALNDTHRELAEVARSFLESHKARQASRALLDAAEATLPPFWSALADLGWLGLHIPEQYGGSGYGLPELAVVLAEMGQAVAPGPFLTTVIASAAIADLGADDLRSAWLAGLANGEKVAGLGLSGSWSVSEGRASGEGGVVLSAPLADLLILASGDDVIIVPTDRPGVTVSGNISLDPTSRSARVSLESVAVSPHELWKGGRARTTDLAWTLAAAEAAGGAEACVEMASEYAKVREQVGRVIGSFGAVKHHCANMLVAAELATASVWDVARAFAGDPAQFSLAAAVAATEALPAYLRNSQLNIQVHGGIGYTWEHDAHLLLRRAATLAAVFEPRLAAGAVTELAVAGVRKRDDIDLPPEAEAIRAEVAPLIEAIAALPEPERRPRLVETGLATPHWPKPWGRAAQAVEQLVIDQEMARVGLKRPEYGITGWVLLTLIQHSTEDQIQRWVRPTLQGELVWCQLFSEPNAGSDAAGIRTKGTRVEGGWLVNGQKVWTSGAQHCQRGLVTVRTDPDAPKHAGITTMVVDMQAKGVDVRPLREATGGAMFNEVFFDDVFIPDDDVVGPVDRGWTVARSTLGNERVSIGTGGPGTGLDLVALYAEHGHRLPGAEESAMRSLNLRRAERAVAGGEPGPEGNVTKLLSAEHAQRVADAALSLLGPEAAISEGVGATFAWGFVFSRALSIAGGTSEITRNQIAERILGLPRDPLIK
jgi:alkylation response protein AidB-like acyl-CoA dehydrogenase